MTSPQTVLVVDDDPDIREGIADVLVLCGYHVVLADSGRAAMDLLQAGPPPALILLDLMMPEMDGWEVLGELRRSDVLSAIPVVVLSAMDQTKAPPAAGYVRKPFDLDELLAVVEGYVRRA